MKKIHNFFTEKGNVSVKVRNGLKTEMLTQIKKALEISYKDILFGADGAYYIPIAEANNTPVYARLELTISVKEPK
jgi:hypothetical protein